MDFSIASMTGNVAFVQLDMHFFVGKQFPFNSKKKLPKSTQI